MEKRIKPFKTISLIERLNQSKMKRPSALFEQGDPSRPITRRREDPPSKIAAQLKIIGEAQKKNAAILKQMMNTFKQPEFPAIKKFTSVTTKEASLQINTNFPKSIRLENRLNQPLDSKTTHLAKYFLSDQYSGIIKVVPFKTPPLKSAVVINPFGLPPDKKIPLFFVASDKTKGSPILGRTLTPLIPTDQQSKLILTSKTPTTRSTLFKQGTLLDKNNEIASVTNTTKPLAQAGILVKQGTTFSNEIFNSVTITRTSILPNFIIQGEVDVKKPIGTTPNAVLQGLVLSLGEVDSSYVKVESIDPIPFAIRGIPRYPDSPKLYLLTNPKVKKATSPRINDTGQPLQPTSTYQLFAPILQNESNDLAILKKRLVGYASAALPFDYSPAPYYRPALQLAAHHADRLLAILSPAIKHGSVAPREPRDLDEFGAGNGLIAQGHTGPDGIALSSFAYQPTNNDKRQTGQGESSKTLSNTGANASISQFVPISDQLLATPSIYQETPNAGNVNLTQWENIIRALAGTGTLNIPGLVNFPKSNEGSLGLYKAVSYGTIKTKVTTAARNGGISSREKVNPQIGKGNGGVSNVPDTGDFIKLVIDSERGGGVRFKAYLTSFSDSFSTSWNDIQYVGRQDTFKQFKGVTRAFSFGISVPSFSKVDLPINMKKVQEAIQITQTAAFNGNYLKGPLCRLTLGGFFTKSPCVFSSVKVDFDPTESTWDIDKGLPHLLKLSFDGAMLGTADGKGMSNTGKIYSFS